jgi:hypothetical protein
VTCSSFQKKCATWRTNSVCVCVCVCVCVGSERMSLELCMGCIETNRLLRKIAVTTGQVCSIPWIEFREGHDNNCYYPIIYVLLVLSLLSLSYIIGSIIILATSLTEQGSARFHIENTFYRLSQIPCREHILLMFMYIHTYVSSDIYVHICICMS